MFKNSLTHYWKNLLIKLYQKIKLMWVVYNFGFYIYVKYKRYGDILHGVRGYL